MRAETVLITGASRGIGRAVALQLAKGRSGPLRLALAARGAADLDVLAAELRTHAPGPPLEVLPVMMDVADAGSVRAGMEQVRQRYGAIEAAVLNAGIAESAPLEKTSDEMFARLLDVNLWGVFRLLRELLAPMKEARRGRVVVVASLAGKIGYPYVSAYCASKHAVLGLVRTAALEVAEHGVTVNAVCPGFVETDLTEQSVKTIEAKTGRDREQILDAMRRRSPQHRLFQPEEVAATVQFLLSEAARGINGEAINVDGGELAG